MKKLLGGLCATALLAATFTMGTATANAGPMSVPAPAVTGHIHLVQGMDGHGGPRWQRGGHRYSPRHYRGGPRHGFYRGHRGYRDRRPGYRYHNGFWFPPAAFIAGAIIGGAATRGPGVSSAHVQWCYDRYRSYRSSDNTFQPYQGPRRQCVSPYG